MGKTDTVAISVLMLSLQQPCLTVVPDFGFCPRAAIQRASYLYITSCSRFSDPQLPLSHWQVFCELVKSLSSEPTKYPVVADSYLGAITQGSL